MTTPTDLKKYEELKQELKDLLVEKWKVCFEEVLGSKRLAPLEIQKQHNEEL
jgi:hypothetical protein